MVSVAMTTKTDYDYYHWLTQRIHVPNGKTYFDLFEIMHNTEFVWMVPNDDNRVQDGLDLRYHFLEMTHHRGNLDKLGGATCLEVLVALSRRVAFMATGNKHSHQWAWTLLKNLGLHKFSDPLTPEKINRVNNILHNLIWRQYREDGTGGFFPLQNPDIDQTKIEIWHQLSAYVTEMTDL